MENLRALLKVKLKSPYLKSCQMPFFLPLRDFLSNLKVFFSIFSSNQQFNEYQLRIWRENKSKVLRNVNIFRWAYNAIWGEFYFQLVMAGKFWELFLENFECWIFWEFLWSCRHFFASDYKLRTIDFGKRCFWNVS